jgi:hypothetical protein
MPTQRPSWINRLILYSPGLVSFAIMLPRLASAQFGFFDDGRTLATAAQMAHGSWDWSWDFLAGRFRPVYRLFFSLPYALFGREPFWYFVANAVIFVLAVVGVIALVRRIGGSDTQAWVTGMLFATSGPVAENYYTLSKGEALQLVLLVGSLLLILSYEKLHSQWRKSVLLLMTMLVLFAAHATKETSLIMLPISLVWLLGAWVRQRSGRSSAHLPIYGAYCLANILAGAIFISLRMVFVTQTAQGGSYAQSYEFGLSRLLASTVRWSGWLIRDYSYLAPLLLIAVFWCLRIRRIPQAETAFNSLVWMGAWMGIFLPWQYTVEYYMLSFALGAAFLGGWLLAQIIQKPVFVNKWSRILTIIGLAVSAILFISTLGNNISTARIQLAVDAANDKMLDYLVQQLPTGSTVWINIQASNEYIEQLGYLKDGWRRTDINLQLFHNPIIPGNKDYIVTPFVANLPLLTVRMGVIESSQLTWTQDLNSFLSEHPDWKQVFETDHRFQLIVTDLPRLFCPWMQGRNFCAVDSPILNTRAFSYGWRIYQQENP